MSTPLEQQQQTPVGVSQQAYSAHRGHGSVGPVIAVLAVITILGVMAGMIGRLCSGRPIMGHGQYDFEGWVERKCSSCLDGRATRLRRGPRRRCQWRCLQRKPNKKSKKKSMKKLKFKGKSNMEVAVDLDY